jgi:3-oxoacyl-[acyl-carrier-protein] synthase II
VGGFDAIEGALTDGRSGIAPLRAFPVERLRSRLAAEIPEGALAELIARDEARRLSRICQLTVAACRLAVRDARLDDVGDGSGLALIVGSEFGDIRSTAEFADGYLKRGPVGLSPMIFPNTVMNTMGATASIAVGARGPSVTINQATVSGEIAVARAMEMVATGRLSAALAGGVDEIAPVLYRMLSTMGALAPVNGGEEGCYPFDRRHNGPVLGEGATFVVLEALEDALQRGATIRAELRGAAWGATPAGPHRVPSRCTGTGTAIRRALGRARLHEDAIGWAYLSGNGDPPLDDWQLERVGSVFDGRPLLTSLTPLAGDHAGLGAFRVGAAAWTARSRRLPPLSALSDPVRPEFAFATGNECAAVEAHGLVHGVARGGAEVALVISPFEV